MNNPEHRPPAASPLSWAVLSGSTPLVLVVLALTVIGSLNRAPAPEARPDRGTAASVVPGAGRGEAAAPLADPRLAALEPLRQFLDDGGGLPPGSDEAAILNHLREPGREYQVEVLIATLPDPRESHLAYEFDAMLEAIHLAVGVNHHRDRYDLPWLSPAAKASDNHPGDASKEVAAGKREGTRAGAILRLSQPWFTRPGTLLFRKKADEDTRSDPRSLLVVFLVGETPTWGVQTQALMAGLDLARALAPRAPRIKILGPTFSGSAESLARALSRWWARTRAQELAAGPPPGDDPEFWVCSGSATALAKKPFITAARPARVRLAATVVPDAVALREMFGFLGVLVEPREGQGGRTTQWLNQKVAILAEAGTAYGEDTLLGSPLAFEGAGDFITIPFPLHVAAVRGVLADRTRGVLTPPQRGYVPLPIDEVTDASDRAPALAPRMSTAADGLVLQHILATIRNEGVKYVGIVATDVLDMIFLTGLIRDHCPDVQLFVPVCDLRFTDPDTTFDFRGAFVVSSYPLDLEMQEWCFPHYGYRRRRMFPTGQNIGVYNAALLLEKAGPGPSPDQLVVAQASVVNFLAYGPPFDQLQGGLDPGASTRPAVWISQVGVDNIWPVKVVPLSGENPGHARALDLIPPVIVPAQVVGINPLQDLPGLTIPAAAAVLGGGAVLALLTGLLLAAQGAASGIGPHRSRGMAGRVLLYWDRRNHVSPPRYGFAALAVVMGALLPSVAVLWALDQLTGLGLILCWRGLNKSPGWQSGLLLVVVWVGALLAAGPVAAWADVLTSPGGQRLRLTAWADRLRAGRRGAVAVVPAVALAALAVALTLMAVPGWLGDSPGDWLAAVRWLAVFNGVSPILPLVLLGVALAIWGGLELQVSCWSNRVLGEIVDLLPATAGKPFPLGQLEDQVSRPVRLLSGWPRSSSLHVAPAGERARQILTAWGPAATLGGVLAALTAGYIFVGSFFPTPEDPWLGWTVRAVAMVLVMVLALSLIRLVRVWSALEGLLDYLGTLPIGASLERLAPRVKNHFRRFVGTPIETETDWTFLLSSACAVVDALEERARAGPWVDPDDPRGTREQKLAELEQQLRSGLEAEGPPSEPVRQALKQVGESDLDLLRGRFAAGVGQAGAAPGSAAGDSAGAGPLDRFEDDLTLRLVLLVRRFAVPLRASMAQAVFGSLLLCMAMAWYPFEPQRLIAAFLWGFLLAATTTAVVIVIRTERNPFVSGASGTRPGSVSLDWGLIASLTPYVVPTVAFLIAVFPGVSFWLRSLLAPLGNALR